MCLIHHQAFNTTRRFVSWVLFSSFVFHIFNIGFSLVSRDYRYVCSVWVYMWVYWMIWTVCVPVCEFKLIFFCTSFLSRKFWANFSLYFESFFAAFHSFSRRFIAFFMIFFFVRRFTRTKTSVKCVQLSKLRTKFCWLDAWLCVLVIRCILFVRFVPMHAHMHLYPLWQLRTSRTFIGNNFFFHSLFK